MPTYDGYPEYDEITQGGEPRAYCDQHMLPHGCVVSIYPKRVGRFIASACPLCFLVDDDVERLLACWNGTRWVEGDVWRAWRQIVRATLLPDFDPYDLLWEEMGRALRRPRYVVGPLVVAPRWLYVGKYPGQTVAQAVGLLGAGEELLGSLAFGMSPDELQTSLDRSRARWNAWCAAVWALVSPGTKYAIAQLGPGPSDDDYEQWLERLQRVPTPALVEVRDAAQNPSLPEQPSHREFCTWSGYGDVRSVRGLALVLTRWAGATDQMAGLASLAGEFREQSVLGPNGEAVRACLDAARDYDDLQILCLTIALPMERDLGPDSLAMARSSATAAAWELQLFDAEMRLNDQVLATRGVPLPALRDRVQGILVQGLIDDDVVAELSFNWENALEAAERIRDIGAMEVAQRLGRGWTGTIEEFVPRVVWEHNAPGTDLADAESDEE